MTSVFPAPLNHVAVWIAPTDPPEVQARLGMYRQYVLSPAEARRAARFLQPDDEMRFIIGRALARTMLSRYSDVPPREWPFIIGDHGRPELAERLSGTPDLRFNLTHTPGLVACGVTVGREIGVDVEQITRCITHEVPERFFSPHEVADLRALPEAEQQTVFFDYWTLKEAYIKARGLGLALPLHHFTFLRTTGRAPVITFSPELHDDPATWQFGQFWPTSSHRMAVAVRRTGADLPIVVEQVIPEIPEVA